jgi:hypothetical protein
MDIRFGNKILENSDKSRGIVELRHMCRINTFDEIRRWCDEDAWGPANYVVGAINID